MFLRSLFDLLAHEGGRAKKSVVLGPLVRGACDWEAGPGMLRPDFRGSTGAFAVDEREEDCDLTPKGLVAGSAGARIVATANGFESDTDVGVDGTNSGAVGRIGGRKGFFMACDGFDAKPGRADAGCCDGNANPVAAGAGPEPEPERGANGFELSDDEVENTDAAGSALEPTPNAGVTENGLADARGADANGPSTLAPVMLVSPPLALEPALNGLPKGAGVDDVGGAPVPKGDGR